MNERADWVNMECLDGKVRAFWETGDGGWLYCNVKNDKAHGRAFRVKDQEWITEEMLVSLKAGAMEEQEEDQVDMFTEAEAFEADEQEDQEQDGVDPDFVVDVETRIENSILTERLAVHLQTQPKQPKTVTVECEDCKAPRVIKVQDAFQVKRCPDCQKKHRNRKRAERRKQRRLEAKQAQEQQ